MQKPNRSYLQRAFTKMTLDAVAAAVSLLAAALIVWGGQVPEGVAGTLVVAVPLIAVGKVAVNALLGTYRGMWVYASVNEALNLAAAAGVSFVLLWISRALGLHPLALPILVVDLFVYLVVTGGFRLLRRIQFVLLRRMHAAEETRLEPATQRVLFVGAGDTADALIREILKSRHKKDWDIVGLLDDDPRKHGARLHGFPVLGGTSQLEAVVQREGVDRVIVAMPSTSKSMIRHMIVRAQSAGARVQAAPALDRFLRYGSSASSAGVTLGDLVESTEVRELIQRRSRNGGGHTVLVTGGAGYIGSHVVQMLLDRDYRVRVLDNFTYGSHGLAPVRHHPNLEVLEGDISSIRDMVSAVRDVDSVIALAAIVGDPACGLNAEETLTLNYESTKILVELCNFYGVSRLVFASSCSVYGASDSNLLTEESPLNPVSLYARTRILSEDVIFERSGDVVPVVLRLATVFGLSRRMRFDLVVNALTVHAAVRGKMRVFGGRQWRPFVHCRDAARAFIDAATAPSDLVRGEVFNVGNEALNYRIADVADAVAREIPQAEIEDVGSVDDPRNYRVSFRKIGAALGFEPEHDLRSGIREIRAAVESQPHLRQFEDSSFSNVKWLKDRFEREVLAAS